MELSLVVYIYISIYIDIQYFYAIHSNKFIDKLYGCVNPLLLLIVFWKRNGKIKINILTRYTSYAFLLNINRK